MKIFLIALWALVLSAYLGEVASVTNKEFFEAVEPYATDVETVDEVDEEDDEELGVIELPGGPDDELDIEYLMKVLENDISMPSTREIEYKQAKQDVGWFRRRRRRRRGGRRRGGSCSCSRDRCYCCINKSFKINLIFKKIKFRLNACVTVAYLRSNRGFSITITFNGRRLYHREISLRHPPALCYAVPGLKYVGKVCVEIYNVNLGRKSMCVRLVGVINLRVKKFKLRLKLACFRIPILEEDIEALQTLANDPHLVEMNSLATAYGSAFNESRDFSYALLAVDDISHLFKDLQELNLESSEYYDDEAIELDEE